MTASPSSRLAELLGALSLAADLGVGVPPDASLRACAVATHLAAALGLDAATRRTVFYASLLRHLGCTAWAHEAAAAVAVRAARADGVAAEDVTRLEMAALLHDLGAVSVSNQVWEHPGALGSAAWEKVRLHAYYTERILSRAAVTAPMATLAGAHHERLGGALGARGRGRPAPGPGPVQQGDRRRPRDRRTNRQTPRRTCVREDRGHQPVGGRPLRHPQRPRHRRVNRGQFGMCSFLLMKPSGWTRGLGRVGRAATVECGKEEAGWGTLPLPH